jgi:uncharacterized protein (TIGR03435 family)
MRFLLASWMAVNCCAQPAVFDAASVKTVDLATHPVFGNRGGPGTSDPGRIHLCCVGMYSLLMRAYDVEIDQISGPGWILENMGPNLYEVDAVMPGNTTKAQYQEMMRSLLADRFHLQVHRESRNFPGYDLVVAKSGPRLKESKSDSGVAAEETPGPQMLTSLGRGMVRVQVKDKPLGDLVQSLGRLIAQSMGTDPADFSSRKARVHDGTGLTGKYDFVLEFGCEACRGLGTNLPMVGGRGDGPAEVSESGLPDIFIALQNQLGLKLEKTRDIPLDVIVVDRVDKVPTGN